MGITKRSYSPHVLTEGAFRSSKPAASDDTRLQGLWQALLQPAIAEAPPTTSTFSVSDAKRPDGRDGGDAVGAAGPAGITATAHDDKQEVH